MRSKTIFRYAGGKSKAVKYIRPFWEKIPHDEYREPFVGGGSIFINKPNVEVNWINDIDKNLIAFYKVLSKSNTCSELINDLINLDVTQNTYDELYYSKPNNNYDRAKKFYFLNRTSFSGITRWRSFIGDVRYNIKNNQNTLRDIGIKLRNYKITSFDFESILNSKTKLDTFMFLDPPYAESRQIVAYDNPFIYDDHMRLAKILKSTKIPFLMTYDDTRFTRELYGWAYLTTRTWTYSIANARIHHNPRESGNELFISNFEPILYS